MPESGISEWKTSTDAIIIIIFLGNVSLGFESQHVRVDALGPIALAYEKERKAGEHEMEWNQPNCSH